MSAASLTRYLYLGFLSKPKSDRTLYRWIRRHRCASIVEIGLGDGLRATRLIEAAERYVGARRLSYCGVDPFEMRMGTAHLSLKQMHRRLYKTSAQIRLLPGDPLAALSRGANALSETDLVVLTSSVDDPYMAEAWFYVPRMLHSKSALFTLEKESDGPRFTLLSRSRIGSLAARATSERAA